MLPSTAQMYWKKVAGGRSGTGFLGGRWRQWGVSAIASSVRFYSLSLALLGSFEDGVLASSGLPPLSAN